MFDFVFIIIIFGFYVLSLFLIALYVEKRAQNGKDIGNNPFIYSLTLTIFITTWTFYGGVGVAAKSGTLFLTTYLGPTLTIFLWWFLLRKIILLKNYFRITSIADFISVRYNKSTSVAAIVTIISMLGIIPYISIQLKSIVNTFSIITYPALSSSDPSGNYTGHIITSITPNSGMNTGIVAITNLAGRNFQSGATVKLCRTGQGDINATEVHVVSANQITCTLDLSGVATGTWDIVVTNPDNNSSAMVNGSLACSSFSIC